MGLRAHGRRYVRQPRRGDINATVDLPVGASATFTITATVDATLTGSLANTATVSPAPGTLDPDGSNNTATDKDTLTPQADLTITKTDGRTSAMPGTATSYTIVVRNVGPSAVLNAAGHRHPAGRADRRELDLHRGERRRVRHGERARRHRHHRRPSPGRHGDLHGVGDDCRRSHRHPVEHRNGRRAERA